MLNCYQARILMVLRKQKEKENEHPSSGRILPREIHLRLLILGCGELAVTLPLSVLMLLLDLTNPTPYSFWPGWANVHRDFNKIPVTAASDWRSDIWQILTVEWDLWMSATTAITFFMFFGSTQESRAVYRSVFRRIRKALGSQRSATCGQPMETVHANRGTAQSMPE